MASTKVTLIGDVNIQNKIIIETLSKIEGVKVKIDLNNKFEIVTGRVENKLMIVLVDFEDFKQIKNKIVNERVVIFNFPHHMSYDCLLSVKNLKGLLFRNASREHLISCIERVAAGDLWLPRKLMADMLNKSFFGLCTTPDFSSCLTRRENEILIYIVNGYSNQQIADSLYVTESTIKTHIYKIYRKLNVSCRRDVMSLVR
ncbi:helix-turn-helix transcriptional regulator [Vibrio fluminensis]|uniref:helix-turn-helix transcriptional regulator n=1 Tax=Vibrio fluminensis TaxID=2783614 RepID=UPI001888BD61|nr:response regulator transcription factor [Vibrio fluminensis]